MNSMEGAEHNVRMIVRGEVDGYPIDIYVYDTDIERGITDEDELAMPYEPGVVQWVTSSLKEHSVTPPKGSGGGTSENGNRTSRRSGTTRNKGWKCKWHGEDYVKSQYRNPDKMECDYKEEADEDDDDAPEWANPDKDGYPRYSKKEDKYYWYCKGRQQ